MQGLGYPARTILIFAATLALVVHWLVEPFGKEWIWLGTVGILIIAMGLVARRTRYLSRAREQSAPILKALSAATTDIPVNLRTRMPLMLVMGDALASLFDRKHDEQRLVFIGDGAIWLRVERTQDLPHVALAMRQWRDGQSPDGVALCIAPALHADADSLTQHLRVARQTLADVSRMVGARLPGYVTVYQRLTGLMPRDGNAARQWHGASASAPLTDALRFEAVVRHAESHALRHGDDPYAAAHAAALASIVGWTQRVVFGALTDPRQPAAPWTLHGACWIDCGPASDAGKPWERDVARQTCITPASVDATPAPWPLPQPLIEAMPRRVRSSPRLVAFAHAIGITALAAGAAFLGAGKHNAELLRRVRADLAHYASIAPDHDDARRDALHALVADRDELDRYARTGVPPRLSFGLYHGAALLPRLNAAIASYQPPPAVVTLDSMSLFDSGKAQLKPGSTRALVEALQMIRAHPGKLILVAGHTDNSGDAASNLKLSIARAAALRDWLIEASGIAATRFAVQGYGDTRPIADNDTPEGRAKNRRVEITLVPDMANDSR
ncbi:OmpA family protein [Caballeronia ptereochthonis]|uniref:OmpA family protein n=1 Tax=Caballeronia ptereochthonis TaxID=1777144 RepID=A0A158B3U3_9BURK|nr:OmpA family protein [Caballeronia ptereochthonis]SAK64724.1 OmpA family protein [Caballeronia ptereochthonis]